MARASWNDYLTQSETRNKIISWAMIELLKTPYVSDRYGPDAKGNRSGGERLKEFFDVAVSGWGPEQWKDQANLDGVMKYNKRVPKVLHWCGIFATYCLIKAGVDAKWFNGFSPAIRGKGTRYAGDNKGIKPGDVGVRLTGDDHTTNHHFVVIAVNDDGKLETIDGNTLYQEISYNTPAVKELYGHYSIQD
jgi:hypothetical protein